MRADSFGFTILAFPHFADAKILYRVLLPADILLEIGQKLKHYLAHALLKSKSQIIVHKADLSKVDPDTLLQELGNPSNGVIVLAGRPDQGVNWVAYIFAERSGAQPLYSIGMTSSLQGFAAQIGADVWDYTDFIVTRFG